MRAAVIGVVSVAALAVMPLVSCDDEGGNGGGTGVPTGTSGGQGGQGAQGGSAGTGGETCDPSCEQEGHLCCGDRCLNGDNDILNCGDCDNECTEGRSPFCDEGTCGTPPCGNPPSLCEQGPCCGDVCCGSREICCVVPGASGPEPPRCVNPDDHGGTCPKGF